MAALQRPCIYLGYIYSLLSISNLISLVITATALPAPMSAKWLLDDEKIALKDIHVHVHSSLNSEVVVQPLVTSKPLI